MKMKLTFALVSVFGVLSGVRGFDVPEPVFEVFHPNGLRVSIPDTEGIKSVQFLLSVKTADEGAVEMFDDPDKPEDGRWIFWNPDAVLQIGDEIYYKITAEYDDLYWNKEGEHNVEKVFSIDGGVTEETPRTTHHLGLNGLKNPSLFRHRNRGLITEGKKSTFHSSYSSYEGPNTKPITRSSTSSATGTFLMRPNGEVEASGYKKSESYDSTKREGEQWEMSESEMTAEELEELKRFIGPSFRSFSDLTKGQVEEFKRLHGGSFHMPERITSGVHHDNRRQGGVQTYEESYFTKESSSSTSRNQGQRGGYARQPSYWTYAPHMVPEPETNRYEESHRYDHQASSSAVRPVALQHNADSDYQQHVPAVLPPQRHNSGSYEFSRGESHRVVTNQASSSRPKAEASYAPSYLHEEELDRRSSAVTHQQTHEEDVQVVERPKYQTESHYTGSIFRMVTSRSGNPQECSVWAETNYDHVTDLKEIQKSISKLSCLAGMAENSMKEELRLVKQQNAELLRKVETLDRDFRRYKESCRCSG